jgi:pimeloyl-ACP methyl ester carboxylesterase
MAIASIAGIELSYRVAGPEGRTPVVFIHGYTGNLRNWSLQVKALTARGGFRCLSADNPGHGDSSAPTDPHAYDLDQVAEVLHQLAVGLDFAPAILFGHSMGGAIAEEYAIRYPAHVRALVLVGSAGGASGPERLAMVEQVASLRAVHAAAGGGSAGMGAVYDARLAATPMPAHEALPAQARAFLRDEFMRTHWLGYEHGARALHTRAETLTALADFGKPTLLVHGAAESDALKRVSADLAMTIPGARRVVIPDAGHSPQFENAEAFNREMFAFIDALPSAG